MSPKRCGVLHSDNGKSPNVSDGTRVEPLLQMCMIQLKNRSMHSSSPHA
jgi:hypothetical protein